jgi:hypothetical protein
MIRLYMNVMLSVWKRIVQYSSKRKNRQLSERLFKKPGSYNVFRSDWKGFFRILNSVFFGFGLVSFGLGFQTRPWFLFGLDRLFLSDWIYQKYIAGACFESEGTLDFIVCLRIVYLHKRHK